MSSARLFRTAGRLLPMSAESTSTPASSSSWVRRGRRVALVLLVLAALWTVLLGTWLPGFVRPRIEQAAAEALGVPVSIRSVAVRPWTLEVTVDGLVLGPPAAPLLKLAQAQAQLSLESLWRLAPVLRRVTLVKPELWIERESAERFNFSTILAHLQARPASPPSSEPARFALFNLSLQDGVVRYSDRVLQQTHRIDQLQLGVPFVSNLPSDVQVEVKPVLRARVDGSALAIEGESLPFTEGLRSVVRLKWDDVQVAQWLAAAKPLLPQNWQVQGRDGRLAADITLRFEARKPPAVPMLAIEGNARIDQLGWSLPHAPVLGEVEGAWKTLTVEGVHARPLERQVQIGVARLEGLTWRSRARPPVPAQSRLSLEPVAVAQAASSAGRAPVSAPNEASAAPAAPWSWQVGQVQVQVDKLAVQTEAASAWPTLDRLVLKLDGLSSQAQAAPARWQLDLHDEHDSRLTAQGHVQVASLAVDGRLSLDKAAMSPWLAPVADKLSLPMRLQQGTLGVQAEVAGRLQAASALEPAELKLLSGQLTLSGVQAQATAKGLGDRIGFEELKLAGLQAWLDLGPGAGLRSLSADLLDITRLDAALTRDAQGRLLGMGAPASAGPTRPAAPSALPQVALKDLHCGDCQIRFKDQSVTPAAQFEVRQTDLHVAGISQDLARPLNLSLDTLAQGRGRVQIKGTVQPQPLLVDARVQVNGLDLRAVQPYIDPLVNITLAGAKAQADGQLRLSLPASKPMQVRYRGRVGLRDVRVLDRVNDADFLSWQALSLEGTDVALDGDMVDANLGRIALKDFYGRIIINPNGQLNVAGIMRHEAGGEARSLTTPEAAPTPAVPAAAPTKAVPPPAASAAKPAPRLRWQQIALQQGRIDFTDNFIKPNYSARLTQIQGDVSGVSSTKPEPATVKVSGAVDDAAPLSISGQLHPLGPKLFTDIEGEAKGIELTRLTPYAARYAGYAIEKGTLSVKVHYKVDGGKLDASNQIFLDQLTFGEKTDSPEATKLPVLFAVSLLKNSKGEIDVNLPISGSLDDPQFSVGGIIWRVIVNLITKAVTAPFSFLSGGGTDELGYVPFEPGQAVLSDAARQRLDTLAGKLADRPALKLEATGRAEPVSDTEGLRIAHVDSLMRAAKAKATGEDPAGLTIAPQERSTWLAAAYKAADIKKPRNLVGLAKTLPDAEMEALLKAAAPVGPEALRALANQRGDRVKAYLAQKLPPERVLLTASKVGADGLPDDKGPASRVQFEIK
jgi:hypothetical protein